MMMPQKTPTRFHNILIKRFHHVEHIAHISNIPLTPIIDGPSLCVDIAPGTQYSSSPHPAWILLVILEAFDRSTSLWS